MSEVIPLHKRKPPVVVKKKDRSQHVGRTGKWTEPETKTLLTKLDNSDLSRSEVIRQTQKETGRSYKSVSVKADSLRPRRPQIQHDYGPPAPKHTGLDPQSPVALMLATLSGRVRTNDVGYTLDGRPSSFYLCIREANRVRKGQDEPQITGSPEWVV